MADSYAGLVYGINAHACDLLAAMRAHSSIHPALHAVDQVAQLCRKGALQVRKPESSAIERVPSEIWLMVEQSLIGDALRVARTDILERLVCEECDHARAEDKAEELATLGHVLEVTDMLLDHFLYEAKSMREWHVRRCTDEHWSEGYELNCEGDHFEGPWEQEEWLKYEVLDAFRDPVRCKLV